jgi:hypothetical protein
MSTRGYAIAALLAVALLAGCAERTDGGDPPREEAPDTTGPETPVGEKADPTALIGLWTVDGTAEEDGTVLRIAYPGLSLWRSCGVVMGDWRADPSGLFVGGMDSYTGCTPPGGEPTPAWLARVAAFRVDGDARALLDRDGAVVARLLPGGRPIPNPNVAPSEAEPPEVTSDARRGLAGAAPLPDGMQAPAEDALVRRWLPAEDGAGAPEPPYLEFLADGTWRGSDGCNGQGGRWVAGAGGAILTTSGPMTLMACDGVPVGGWLNDARRVGLDGEELVLLDARAREIGRLRPAG